MPINITYSLIACTHNYIIKNIKTFVLLRMLQNGNTEEHNFHICYRIILCNCAFSKSRVVVRAGRYLSNLNFDDLDRRQVICKQWKVSSWAEKIIRITGILILTTKHTFQQERQGNEKTESLSGTRLMRVLAS